MTFTKVTDTLVRCDECFRTFPKRIAFKHRHITDFEAHQMAHRRKDYKLKRPEQLEYMARIGD